MAIKTVCDICGLPLGQQSQGFEESVCVTVTDYGIYASGRIVFQRDGMGERADVCADCLMLKLLASKKILLSQGAKTPQKP